MTDKIRVNKLEKMILNETVSSELQEGCVFHEAEGKPDEIIRLDPGISNIDVLSSDGKLFRIQGSRRKLSELFTIVEEIVPEPKKTTL